MAVLVDDVIADIAEAERQVARPFTFAPVYAFAKNLAHIARGQERQAVLDEVAKLRPEEGAAPAAREAFDAAVSAVIRVIVGRSITD
jgi:hypothetical protein